MGILYLDGNRFKLAVVAAAQRVLERQEGLNKINVFPVPDGDTGTNMALTLKSVAEGAMNATNLALPALSSQLAEAALMGARGNSGAVLAQFFQGISEGFAKMHRVTSRDFAQCMERAVRASAAAFTQPQEGTILTVMREWAAQLMKACEKTACLHELLRNSLTEASRSLSETPKKLKVLARAGVVDAGAQGFVNMLEGVADFMASGDVSTNTQPLSQSLAQEADFSKNQEELTFQFCTECLLDGTNLHIGHIREALGNMGDALVVAGGSQKVRIHIHTNHPKEVFAKAASFGTVSAEKFDDMQAQNTRAGTASQEIAIITDSSCDLPPGFLITHGIRVVPVNIMFAGKTYLDRVTITTEEVYRLMLQEGLQPSTSQPAPAAFHKTYGLAAEHHSQAVAILVSSGVSGTFEAGKTAARLQKALQVSVVDSKTTAAALGLLVQNAVEAAEAGCTREEICRRVEMAREHTRIFVTMETLEYAIRGGRVSRMRGILAKLFNLVPIISFNREGKAQTVGKAKPGQKALQKLLRCAMRFIAQKQYVRVQVCHAAAPQKAQWLAAQLQQHLDLDKVDITAVSPTVGAHVGPGSVAIAVQAFPKGQRPW